MADTQRPSFLQFVGLTDRTPPQLAAHQVLADTPILFNKSPSPTALLQDPNDLNDADEILSLISELKLLEVGGVVKGASGVTGAVKGQLKPTRVIPGIAGQRSPPLIRLTDEAGNIRVVAYEGPPELIPTLSEADGPAASSPVGEPVGEVTAELHSPGFKIPAIPERRIVPSRLGRNVGIGLAAAGFVTTSTAAGRLQAIEDRLSNDLGLRIRVQNRLDELLGRPLTFPPIPLFGKVGDVNFFPSVGITGIHPGNNPLNKAIALDSPTGIHPGDNPLNKAIALDKSPPKLVPPNSPVDPPVDRVEQPVTLSSRPGVPRRPTQRGASRALTL